MARKKNLRNQLTKKKKKKTLNYRSAEFFRSGLLYQIYDIICYRLVPVQESCLVFTVSFQQVRITPLRCLPKELLASLTPPCLSSLNECLLPLTLKPLSILAWMLQQKGVPKASVSGAKIDGAWAHRCWERKCARHLVPQEAASAKRSGDGSCLPSFSHHFLMYLPRRWRNMLRWTEFGLNALWITRSRAHWRVFLKHAADLWPALTEFYSKYPL